jgi:hypothetical protein
VVTQVTNEINDFMIKDYRKRNNPLKPIAQASEFYVQGIRDRITKTSEGLDTFKDWSDLDLLNNKRDGKKSELPRAHCYRACTKLHMEIHSRYHKPWQVLKLILIHMNSNMVLGVHIISTICTA